MKIKPFSLNLMTLSARQWGYGADHTNDFISLFLPSAC